eukprot:g4289.t1
MGVGSTLEWPDQIALEWACFNMWREEPALTDEQIVDFLRQQGWTWLVPGSHGAGAKRKARIREEVFQWILKKASSRLLPFLKFIH